MVRPRAKQRGAGEDGTHKAVSLAAAWLVAAILAASNQKLSEPCRMLAA